MTAMDAVPEGRGSGQGSQVNAYPDSDPGNSDDSAPLRESITLGSGEFVQGARGGQVGGYAAEDGVTLNFEQASLPEFLRVIFETILGENYLIDPQVKGNVTLYTTRPVTRATVLPVVEAVLEQTGYGIQVVPLAHVSAAELEPIIAPFVPNGSTLRVDATRNVLILSGPRYRLDDLLATVRTFDVDWLKGMSFAMFTLEYADAASVVAELDSVIQGAGDSPIAGIVKLVPIERLNAVLAITHRPEHIAVVQKLVDKFDWGIESTSGRRLFVYELENGKAESIAGVLQDIFAGGRESEDAEPVTGSSFPRRFRSAEQVTRSPPEPGGPVSGGASYTATPARRPTTGAADSSDGLFAESQNEVTIIADQDNNAILVLASQQDYRAIEPAIRRLDVAPRQVLIEATIAEVTLSDTLSSMR
jgi:general secretion pathway protein D